jgi:hypothetical protein
MVRSIRVWHPMGRVLLRWPFSMGQFPRLTTMSVRWLFSMDRFPLLTMTRIRWPFCRFEVRDFDTKSGPRLESGVL